MKPKTKKKKNPQDLTLRNLRAMKKEIDSLKRQTAVLKRNLCDLIYSLSSYLGRGNMEMHIKEIMEIK